MGPARKKVLESLPTTGNRTINEVAALNNLSYSSARVHLRELRKAGEVFRTASAGGGVDRYWRSPEAPSQP
jgi:predicted transcriptional regulator